MHGPCNSMLKSDMAMHGPLHGISMDHAWDRMGPQYGEVSSRTIRRVGPRI